MFDHSMHILCFTNVPEGAQPIQRKNRQARVVGGEEREEGGRSHWTGDSIRDMRGGEGVFKTERLHEGSGVPFAPTPLVSVRCNGQDNRLGSNLYILRSMAGRAWCSLAWRYGLALRIGSWVCSWEISRNESVELNKKRYAGLALGATQGYRQSSKTCLFSFFVSLPRLFTSRLFPSPPPASISSRIQNIACHHRAQRSTNAVTCGSGCKVYSCMRHGGARDYSIVTLRQACEYVDDSSIKKNERWPRVRGGSGRQESGVGEPSRRRRRGRVLCWCWCR